MKKLFQPWRTRTGRRAVRGKLFLILLAAFFGFSARSASVVGSIHDLSVGGSGSIKAVSEKNVCVFCHTAHHANGETPLWNHTMSSVSNYVVYSSARFTNLNIIVQQPNGSSRLCLSCHDGTVALGNVSSGAAQIQMQGGVTTMPSGANNLGTDLSADHPISFLYDAALAARDPQIKDPTSLPKAVRLDSQNRLQCIACHNPHDNQYGNFLVMDNTGSALCLTCHQPSLWPNSAHAISPVPVPQAILSKTIARTGVRPKATTVSAFACDNCHANHQAGSTQHLLKSALPEQDCLVCHSGTTAKKNITADFQKLSIHPITLNRQAHSSVEDPVNPRIRHVVCADCHDGHAATTAKATAPNASGALENVAGVTGAGGIIKPLLKEYELCFRCHADSVARGPAVVPRQFVQTNTRLEFSADNQSFHPVEAVGKNRTSVPSLISPWTVNSVMYCTDCHNSDSSPGAGGAGANGPHGSIYRPILERNLMLADNQPESASAYALCYKCHSRSTVLSNTSFRYHKKHVVDLKTACTTCHDSHGVANAPHLINFNPTYVANSSLGTISYISTGTFKGNCTLSCHGKDHKNTSY
jgi:predicted CXXCH cytochrome family protein